MCPRNYPESGNSRPGVVLRCSPCSCLITGTMTKLNSMPVSLKNRPRIPTPDVTKEVVDREQRLAVSANNVANIGAGVVGMIPTNCPPETVSVMLCTIKETDSGTQASGKSTTALAQAVISPALSGAGIMPVTLTPVTMNQAMLTLLKAAPPTTLCANIQNSNVQATLTEVNSSEEEGSGSSSSRSGSIAGQEERSTPLIGHEKDTLLINDNISPIGSNGSSPIFNNYNDRSPILMKPAELNYAVTPIPEAQDNNAMIDTRGRRSASLPSPPVLQPRDDRSMSLPQSPGLQTRETHLGSILNKHNLMTNQMADSNNQNVRSRTNSFCHDVSKPNQKTSQDASRKISSVSCTNASFSNSLDSSSTSIATSGYHSAPPSSNCSVATSKNYSAATSSNLSAVTSSNCSAATSSNCSAATSSSKRSEVYV